MANKNSAQDSEANDKKLIIGGVIGALALIAYFISMGNHYLGPQPSHLAESLASAKFPQWLVDDAKQSQGDYNKLSPTEQQKVMAYVKGTPHAASNEISLIWSGQQ